MIEFTLLSSGSVIYSGRNDAGNGSGNVSVGRTVRQCNSRYGISARSMRIILYGSDYVTVSPISITGVNISSFPPIASLLYFSFHFFPQAPFQMHQPYG